MRSLPPLLHETGAHAYSAHDGNTDPYSPDAQHDGGADPYILHRRGGGAGVSGGGALGVPEILLDLLSLSCTMASHPMFLHAPGDAWLWARLLEDSTHAVEYDREASLCWACLAASCAERDDVSIAMLRSPEVKRALVHLAELDFSGGPPEWSQISQRDPSLLSQPEWSAPAEPDTEYAWRDPPTNPPGTYHAPFVQCDQPSPEPPLTVPGTRGSPSTVSLRRRPPWGRGAAAHSYRTSSLKRARAAKAKA